MFQFLHLNTIICLPLCKQSSQPHRFVLLPGLAASQRGRPGATEGTEDRCGLHNDHQISYLGGSIPLASLCTSPRRAAPRFTVPWRAGEPEAPRSFPPLVRKRESMGSAGRAFTAPLEGNYQHLSVRGQSGCRMIAWGSTDNRPI